MPIGNVPAQKKNVYGLHCFPYVECLENVAPPQNNDLQLTKIVSEKCMWML